MSHSRKPPIVDIHCHTFNAADLPAAEYAANSLLHGKAPLFAELLKGLINAVLGFVDGAALQEEAQKLEQMNAALKDSLRESDDFEPELLKELDLAGHRDLSEEKWDEVFGEAFQKLEDREGREFLETIQREIQRSSTISIDEQLFHGEREWRKRKTQTTAKGALGFVKLMYRFRYKNTQTLIETFPSVELFTPSVIDFGPMGSFGQTGLHTPMRSQMLIHEQISILSILGGPPGLLWPRVHPLFSFNPKMPGSLDLVKEAILERGFLGVKLYPSQGWYPGLGNGDAADEQLLDFYRFCLDYDVPLMTHSSPTMYYTQASNDENAPDAWERKVFHTLGDEYGELRINFGHFGFGHDGHDGDHYGRSKVMAQMMGRYPNIYADTGNHQVHRGDYLEVLEGLFGNPETQKVQERLMYGSDWFMVSLRKEHQELARKNREAFLAHFADAYPAATDSYMGGAAMRYLGLDHPSQKNYQRLKAWYSRQRLEEHLPLWLREDGDELIELPGGP